MNGRFALAAVVAAGVLVCADAVAFAQGCGGGGRAQMQGSPGGGRAEMRGGPGGGRSQMQGFPGGGVSQLQTSGSSQLQGQQLAMQAQLQAMQQRQTAASLSALSNDGYANYARLYAAQKKRQAELQAARTAELLGNR